MTTSLKGKDILATSEWSKSELDQVIDLAFKLKQMGPAANALDILKGKSLLLLWFKNSTRTWNSFYLAMQQLGGFIRSRDASDMHLKLEEHAGKEGESLMDTAKTLDRYCDALGIRLCSVTPDQLGGRTPEWGDAHAIFQQFADYMKAPVLNMYSDIHHPTQSLTDLFTMKEKLGDVSGKKSVLLWTYHPKLTEISSGQGYSLISAQYGMDTTICCPEGYDQNIPMLSRIKEECEKAGTTFELSHDPKEALKGAHAVYPRTWAVNCPAAAENRKIEEDRASQHNDWRLTEDLMKGMDNGIFMHTMPFSRGYEVDASVADGPSSVIYDQAENLLHVRKAFLALLLGDSEAIAKL